MRSKDSEGGGGIFVRWAWEDGDAGCGRKQVKSSGFYMYWEAMGAGFLIQQRSDIIWLEWGKSGRPFREPLPETLGSGELQVEQGGNCGKGGRNG